MTKLVVNLERDSDAQNQRHQHILTTENNVTAMVTTVSGHRFMVVKRPNYVVLVSDKDGKVIQGDRMVLEGRQIWIVTGGTRMMYTEHITRVFILTN